MSLWEWVGNGVEVREWEGVVMLRKEKEELWLSKKLKYKKDQINHQQVNLLCTVLINQSTKQLTELSS